MVKKWDGAAWGGVEGSDTGGGISNTNSYSDRPVIAMDNNGYPMVAWADDPSIYFKRWLP
jgi:hypothetical protein